MSDKVARYELTPKAIADLEDIWRYSAETWSVEQADRYVDEIAKIFETLVQLPALARERREFNPPVRIHIHGEQVIVYIWKDDLITIIRILGGKQNWRGVLEALEE